MKNVEKRRCISCFREYEDALCPYCGGAQNEEHQLPVGTVIRDRYQIGKVLGQGGRLSVDETFRMGRFLCAEEGVVVMSEHREPKDLRSPGL